MLKSSRDREGGTLYLFIDEPEPCISRAHSKHSDVLFRKSIKTNKPNGVTFIYYSVCMPEAKEMAQEVAEFLGVTKEEVLNEMNKPL